MELEEIKEIISLLEESSLNKLRLKNGDFELLLEKSAVGVYNHHSVLSTPSIPQREIDQKDFPSVSEKNKEKSNDIFITSPMVGTYYTSPSPNDPAFVKVGDLVDVGTIICVIEAMKVMNEVKAGVKGKIIEILCKNVQPVEFGTKLFKIEPL